jgi:cytochrome c553
MVMAATVKALPADLLPSLAAHVETLPRQQPTAGEVLAGADLINGRLLFEERCMECHRYNASGEVVFGSPPLVGLQDWYLLAQVQKFRAGTRGTAKGDAMGAKMVASAQAITTDETARDLVAYIMTLNPTPPSPAPADEVTFGTDAEPPKPGP